MTSLDSGMKMRTVVIPEHTDLQLMVPFDLLDPMTPDTDDAMKALIIHTLKSAGFDHNRPLDANIDYDKRVTVYSQRIPEAVE